VPHLVIEQQQKEKKSSSGLIPELCRADLSRIHKVHPKAQILQSFVTIAQ